MRPGKSAPVSSVPVLAAVLALALLAVPLWVPLSPAVAVAGTVAACAMALLRRPSRSLRLVLAAVGLWLLAGHAGAWLLRGRPLGGFAWVLAILYVLPLPLIPWFYWVTFDGHASEALPDHGSRTANQSETGRT
jgi:hypothetical protein